MIDAVAVDRALAGDLPEGHRLTPSETYQAVKRLTREGHTARDVAERLHVSTRTVERHRGMVRPPGNPPAARMRAQNVALFELRRLHPADYRRLYVTELDRIGA